MSAYQLLAGLVLEDGRRWGDAATAWQVADARAILDPPPGAPLQHFLTRPRGGSKTTDLAGIVLAALLDQLPAASRTYWVASDRDQARLGADAVAGLVARSGLSSLVKADLWRVTALRTGSTLEILAADAPGAHGLRSAFTVVDEVAQWPGDPAHKGVWEGLTSGAGKVPGARFVTISTPGDPSGWMAKVYRHAESRPAMWRVDPVLGPLSWADPAFLADQRGLLTDSAFSRLHLGRWAASEDRLVGHEDLRRAVRVDGSLGYVPGLRYKLGLDVGITNDRCVVAVCHAEPDGPSGRRRVVLDHIEVWAASRRNPVDLTEVEDTVASLSAAYARPGKAPLRADPWQAIGLAQRLRARGVPVQEYSFTAQRYANMATTLLTLLRDGLLWLLDNEMLLDELATVRLKETGSTGLLRVDHDSGHHDDQTVALSMAATACLESGWVRPVYTAEQLEDQRRVRRRLGRPMSANIMNVPL